MLSRIFRYPLLLTTFVFLFSTIGVSPNSYAFDYVFGMGYYNKPNIPKPNKGQTIIDPNFKINITRITDKMVDGYIDGGITNQYSMVNVKNADGSYLILRGTGARWYLYNAKTNNMLKHLDFMRGETGPFWDSNDPDIIYYHDEPYTQFRENGPKFYRYNVRTGQNLLVHDFSNDFPQFNWGPSTLGCYIFKEDYCEPDNKTRYWPFWIKEMVSGGGSVIKAAFIYDKQMDKVIGVLYPPVIYEGSKGICTVSPYGNHVLIRSGDFSAANYNITLTSKHTIDIPNQGHGDYAIDSRGNEVFVYQDLNKDYYVMFDLKTGVRYGLLRACGSGTGPYCPGIHVSGNNYKTPGWALISTYAPNGQWSDDQLFMLELNPEKADYKIEPSNMSLRIPIGGVPRVWRLGHTHSVGTTEYYWAQAFASIDQDGKYVYWGSNWDLSIANGGNMETYMLSLPPTWFQDLTNTNPLEPLKDTSPPSAPKGVKIIK